MDEIKAALKSALRQCLSLMGGLEVPMRRWRMPVAVGRGVTEWREEFRPDPLGILIAIRSLKNPKLGLDEFMGVIHADSTLSSVLLMDAGGQPLQSGQHDSWVENFVFYPFVYRYITAKKTFGWDGELFEEIFQRFAADIQSPTAKCIELSPLLNVRLGTPELEITSNIRLRQLSPDEIGEWLNREPYNPGPPVPFPHQLQCAMEVAYERPKINLWEGSQQFLLPAENLLSALRLVTDRAVFVAFTSRRSDSFLTPGGGTSWSGAIHRYDDPVELDADRANDVKSLFNRLEVQRPTGKYELALRRWSDALDRRRSDDQLIDYWIALESLFTPDARQELRYRASLRIAGFLGQTPDQRIALYEQMRKSYDARSDIVHGSVVSPANLAEICRNTRACVHKSLLRILTADRPFDPTSIEINLLKGPI